MGKTGAIRDLAGTLDDPDASAPGYDAVTRARAASILAMLIFSACLVAAGLLLGQWPVAARVRQT